ncbi:adenosylcobinamide-GDP ribazoletransferase [Granulicella sp. 5B5]|uniref:adenosylcobinamide-GDP ribazoletransferase n=1 Tax=Granulicella sp. 5B5 TaxID=1617967 RepID=UPI002107FE2E|nr:adenosylcobinamide-GDP ribazoletransferase [Granulicella sp. 5B5]
MQFLTRIPMPSRSYEAGSLSRSVKFFPLVGLIVGGGAALLHFFLAPHLPRVVTAFVVLVYLVLVTGGLHEDGLADAADGFGGGTSREKVLLILRDSRIGSYGGIALVFSLLGRLILIASLPLSLVLYYLLAANVLCRWTVLPLSYFLPSAREQQASEPDGQGARIARQISIVALIGGTVFSFAISAAFLKVFAIGPILSAILMTWLTGAYYNRRIGGVTGDCFGATIQLAEIGIYLCGAWIL